MIEVTKVVEWDMGHRVPNHANKCRFPHGHRYRLEVRLSGELNSQQGTSSEGMVFDFGDIKRVLVEKIHDVLDHSFMAYQHDTLLTHMHEQYPQEMQVLFVPFIPTAENIIIWCHEQLKSAFPSHVHISHLRLYETPNSWADLRV